MDRITNLKVKNYKCLRDVEVDFEPLTVLVGANGSGKSTILEALQFLSDISRVNVLQAIANRGGLNSLSNPASDETEILVRLEAMVRDKLGGLGVTLGQDLNAPLLAQSTLLDDEWKANELRQPEDQIRRILQFDRGEGFYGIAEILHQSYMYQLTDVSFDAPQVPAQAEFLSPNGNNLASIVLHLMVQDEEFDSLVTDVMRSLVPSIAKIDVKESAGYRIVIATHIVQGVEVERVLAMESSGTKRVLAILAALYSGQQSSYVAIEEPEIMIHPGALRLLAEVLVERSKSRQVIITTHSPDLLDWVPAESIRFVRATDNGTVVHGLSQSDLGIVRDKLARPGELMRMGFSEDYDA